MVCIFFTLFFTAVYIVEWFILQTIYELKKEILQFLGPKSVDYNQEQFQIKSSFKSRAGYNGVRTVVSVPFFIPDLSTFKRCLHMFIFTLLQKSI